MTEPQALHALARSIASSRGWSGSAFALVIRSTPQPALALLGRFDRSCLAWLQGQERALNQACGSLRYSGYPQVHADCGRLAATLTGLLAPEELARARFAAIPRGGFVVLGFLAMILGLDREQLDSQHSGSPLVVVDDCALSGARFKQFLDRHEDSQIVFAPLYSHPELRAAIAAREPRVLACVSAADLHDHTPPDLAPEHRERRLTRLAQGRYWIGTPEALCFPWNEPDRTFWNPETERHELAWRIVPPELCFKNRPRPDARTIPIQEQPEGKGPLRPAESILFGEIEGEVVLCDLDSGESFRFAGIGSDLWRALLRQGTLEGAAGELRGAYDVSEATLLADARRFTESLLARGLLRS